MKNGSPSEDSKSSGGLLSSLTWKEVAAILFGAITVAIPSYAALWTQVVTRTDLEKFEKEQHEYIDRSSPWVKDRGVIKAGVQALGDDVKEIKMRVRSVETSVAEIRARLNK